MFTIFIYLVVIFVVLLIIYIPYERYINKKSQKKVEIIGEKTSPQKQEEIQEEEEVPHFISRTSFSYIIIDDLDYEFINLIYFPDEIEKKDFIEGLEKVINKKQFSNDLEKIHIDYNRHEKLIGKIGDYLSDFFSISHYLKELLIINEYKYTKRDKEEELIILPFLNKEFGEKKLKNNQLAIDLSLDNLTSKLNNECYDFHFEEELINKILNDNSFSIKACDLFKIGSFFFNSNQFEKLKNFYIFLSTKDNQTLFKLCASILKLKLDLNQSDFQTEENYITKLLSDNNQNYDADSLTDVGFFYFKLNQLQQMEKAFNLLLNNSKNYENNFSLNCRTIGEIYLELNNKVKAIEWFEIGITQNPKLGVKRILDKLKNESK